MWNVGPLTHYGKKRDFDENSLENFNEKRVRWNKKGFKIKWLTNQSSSSQMKKDEKSLRRGGYDCNNCHDPGVTLGYKIVYRTPKESIQDT